MPTITNERSFTEFTSLGRVAGNKTGLKYQSQYPIVEWPPPSGRSLGNWLCLYARLLNCAVYSHRSSPESPPKRYAPAIQTSDLALRFDPVERELTKSAAGAHQ
jgi:hypothetical protein